MAVWRYQLEHDFIMDSDALLGVVFYNEWVTIHSGRMHIKKGYAWDGCSPSYPIKLLGGLFIPHGFWIGIWDGPLGTDARPVSWKASLCHDVLCQFREQIAHITKEDTIQVFQSMLQMNHAPHWMWALYPLAVRWFGPQAWGNALFSSL